MRFQFIPFAAPSHITLMVPLAWALQTAGHEVRFAVPPNFVDTVARTGLLAVPFGVEVDIEDSDEVQPDLSELAQLSGLDCDGSPRDEKIRAGIMGMLAAYFAFEVLQPTTTELIELTQAWQPDLVVWDALCFHGSVAAAVSGAASARLITGIDHSARMRAGFVEREAAEDHVAQLVNGIVGKYGAEFSERIMVGDWTINPLPVIVPNRPELDTVTIRQISFSHVTTPPSWVFEPPARPRVCLTLGRTVRDSRGNDNFGISIEDLFAAVGDLDIEVVATFTAAQLPPELKVPDNVQLVDFVPMNLLMPTCSAVIHHSGPSTMMSAVWYEVPQVIIPPSIWDEEELAAAVADYGAGITIAAGELTAAALRAALVAVLDDVAFLEGARRLRDATLCVPGPNEVVPMLERLTRASVARR